jgi:hypothetical protein
MRFTDEYENERICATDLGGNGDRSASAAAYPCPQNFGQLFVLTLSYPWASIHLSARMDPKGETLLHSSLTASMD